MGINDLIKLSPSAADRWMHCRGSALYAKLKKFESSVYAARGTAAADLLEKAHGGYDVNDALGKSFIVDGHDIKIDQEDIDAVLVAVEDATFAAEIGGMEIESEQSIELNIAGIKLRGRFDLLYYDEATLEVTDYKHGVGVAVEAEYNFQLFLYLMGAVERLGPREQYSLHIIQPRSKRGPKRSSWILTHEEYENVRLEVEKQIGRVVQLARSIIQYGYVASAEPFSAGHWCKWCPGELCCPAKAHSLLSASLGQKAHADSDAFVRFILDHEEELKGSIKKASDRAYEKLMAGEKIEGYKLVDKTAQTKWDTDLSLDQYEVLEAAGLVERKRVLGSITEARKAEKKGLIDLRDYTTKKSSGYKVVPASHKGDEVFPVEQLFDVQG